MDKKPHKKHLKHKLKKKFREDGVELPIIVQIKEEEEEYDQEN